MFRNPFSFEGRIRRLEYVISFAIYFVSVQLLGLGFNSTFNSDSQLLILVLFVPLLWFIIAQGTKRCHDRGNSGAWLLIPFYSIFLLFADGEIQMNEYGDDPKGRGKKLIDELLSEENELNQ